MATLVAPVAAQLRLALPPAVMLVGFAVKALIEGFVPGASELGLPVAPTQPERPAETARIATKNSQSVLAGAPLSFLVGFLDFVSGPHGVHTNS
jgi:hypothetical protein